MIKKDLKVKQEDQKMVHSKRIKMKLFLDTRVTSAQSVIKHSYRLQRKYLSVVKRLGKNHAIVAIARILIETIYIMLVEGK
jgi:hypothetical protein